jgi:hypothetical protein
MNRELVQKVVDEARNEGANLVICDRRDTFTIEPEEIADVEVIDDYLRAKMQDGKVTAYVELASIYKLVVEKERIRRAGLRTGFGVAES